MTEGLRLLSTSHECLSQHRTYRYLEARTKRDIEKDHKTEREYQVGGRETIVDNVATQARFNQVLTVSVAFTVASWWLHHLTLALHEKLSLHESLLQIHCLNYSLVNPASTKIYSTEDVFRVIVLPFGVEFEEGRTDTKDTGMPAPSNPTGASGGP